MNACAQPICDVISFGETLLRLSPPANTRLENSTTLASYVAGAESNVLACLARLGLRTTWLSALPTTALGRRVAGELQRHGVDTDHVVWTDGARLGTFFAEELPHPLGVHVHYDRSHSACAEIDPDQIDPQFVDRARLVHLTGITPSLGTGPRAVWQRLVERARDRNIPIAFDVNYRAKLWSPAAAANVLENACQAASVVFCTRADAADLWGVVGDVETVLQRLAARWSRANAAQTIVLTLGADGAAQIHDGTITRAAAVPSDGTVRFGSGDAFAAGYLYAYLNHAQAGAPALAWGNAAAALKRCIAGDIATITLAELKGVVHGQQIRFR